MPYRQAELINSIRHHFPRYSYSKIAQVSGLNISRVYRVFNGSELKISEYLALRQILSGQVNSNFQNHNDSGSSKLKLIDFYRSTLSDIKKKAGV